MHEAIVEELAANAQEIADIVDRHSASALHARPGEDEWSIAEIIGHIRAADAIWTPRILFALVHDGITMPNVDERALQGVLDASGFNLLDQATLLAFGRGQLVGILRALTEDEWSHTCRHTTKGEMAVIDLVDGLLRHERDHLAQLRAVVAGLAESFAPEGGR
jgi:hypothetical protein